MSRAASGEARADAVGRGTGAASGRWLLGAGAATLGVAWLAPLGRWVPGPFSAYMTMHVAVVAVAAPLIALGLSGGRADPVRWAPALFAPLPAATLELMVVWGWHAPALHQAARTTAWVTALEQGTFLLSGLLVWLAAFGGGLARRQERRAAGVVALLLTSMHMTLLGALLALPPRPLYAGAASGPAGGAAAGGSGASMALTALEDQHVGGAIMLAVGGAVYLAGGLALTLGLLRGRPSAAAPARRNASPGAAS